MKILFHSEPARLPYEAAALAVEVGANLCGSRVDHGSPLLIQFSRDPIYRISIHLSRDGPVLFKRCSGFLSGCAENVRQLTHLNACASGRTGYEGNAPPIGVHAQAIQP